MLSSFLNQINDGHRISIHLPDYVPGNNILDPISDDREIYELSHKIINMTASFVHRIIEKTGYQRGGPEAYVAHIKEILAQ